MRNHWLEEIRIKEVVQLLTTLLNDEFVGEIPDPQQWLVLIENLIDTLYADDMIILNGLVRYGIDCDVDDWGLVKKLELVENI